MKPIVFVALAGLAAASAAGAWFVLKPGGVAGAEASAAPSTPRLINGLNESADNARVIEITRDGETLRMERISGQWGLAGKGGYPIDAAKLRTLMIALADLSIIEPKTANAANHASLELAEPDADEGPATRVRVLGEAGTMLGELLLGRPVFEGGGQRLFVRRPGEDQTYLAKGDVRASTDTAAWINPEVLAVPRDQIERVVVARADEAYTLVGGLDAGVLNFRVDPMPTGKKMSSRFIGGSVAGVFAGLRAQDVDRAAALADAEAIGSVTATTKGGLEVRISIYTRSDGDATSSWLTVGATGEGSGPIAARVDGWAYEVEDFTAEALLRPLGEMLADADPIADPAEPARTPPAKPVPIPEMLDGSQIPPALAPPPKRP